MVHFTGKTGAGGFRAIKTDKGGWRYGFVALLKDGTRKYSEMGTANVENGGNPDQSLSFGCPGDCSKLWLVVSGAPQEHWRHPWDDNDANDEQWPYQVQFKNTNLRGKITAAATPLAKNASTQTHPAVSKRTIRLPETADWTITDFAGRRITSGYGESIDLAAFPNGGYILHYFGKRLRLMNFP